MKRYLTTPIIVLMIMAGLTGGASATTNRTETLDGTNGFAGDENLGTEAGRTGYLTWDASNLYIGITGNPIVGTNSNLYVVVDNTAISNADPRSGAGRSDQPTGESGGATYPFNADVVFLFYGASGEDSSVQNPAPGLKYTVSGGSWSSASIPTGVRIIRKSSAITELEIPFSELGVALNADFNILFYVANNTTGGNNFAQWPTGNANGNNPVLKDFYTYTRKSGVSPNSGQHYSYREHSTSSYSIGGSTFGSIFFVPGSATTFNAGSLTTLGYHLYIGPNATFSMGSNTAALTVGKNVTIAGTLILSTASGGNLNVGGNWTNNGTFNANSRLVTFNGSGAQSIGGTNTTTFAYLTIASGSSTTLAQNINVANDFEVFGTFSVSDKTLTLQNGTDLEIKSGGTVNGGSGTIVLEGTNANNPDFINAGTFNAGTATVHFKGQNTTNNYRNGRVWGPNATTFNNVTLTYNGTGSDDEDQFGVDFYDQSTSARATIAGTLTINPRTFVAHAEPGSSSSNPSPCSPPTYARDCGTPTYGSGSTLRYNDLEYEEADPGFGNCPAVPELQAYQPYGEWLNAASGHGVPHNVTVGSDSWVGFSCYPGLAYRVNGTFTVEAGVDGNTLGGTGTTPPGYRQNGFSLGEIGSSKLTVVGDVVNNGTLKQSGTVGGSVTVSFVKIQDAAATPNTLYYGVDITNNLSNSLGYVTVRVSGNQTTCPYWGDPPTHNLVKRCYDIRVENEGDQTIRFYYEYAELSGFNPNSLYVWQETGGGNWLMRTPSVRSTCTSGQINCYVEVTIVTTVLASSRPTPQAGGLDALFVLSGNSPLAVDLSTFTAEAAADGIALAWETVSEADNAGFRVLRSETADGERTLLAFVPAAAPGSAAGASYRYVDTAVRPGRTYWYWLEAVDLQGATALHGPVSAQAAPAGPPRRLWLPLVN